MTTMQGIADIFRRSAFQPPAGTLPAPPATPTGLGRLWTQARLRLALWLLPRGLVAVRADRHQYARGLLVRAWQKSGQMDSARQRKELRALLSLLVENSRTAREEPW